MGENAQGKTSLLEAISLICTGKSFRSETLSDLIQDGKDTFFIEAELVDEFTSQRVKISVGRESKQVKLGSNTYTTLTPLLGVCPSVFSTPEDLNLIMGSPLQRRRFLNIYLAQKDPLYVHHLSRYTRALKQRNALLKRKKEGGIEIFEAEMAHSGAFLYRRRDEAMKELQNDIQTIETHLGPDKISLNYTPSFPETEEKYFKHLEKMRRREIEAKTTLYGPHRDDFQFRIQGRLAKLYASEGQKKTALSTLRIAEWQSLSRELESLPMMAIDDFGNSLDGSRLSHLLKFISGMSQVFLTTPTPLTLFKEANIIRIQEGQFVESFSRI